MKHEVHHCGSETLYWHCPGCGFGHSANLKLGEYDNPKQHTWTWNGSVDKCTMEPSFLLRTVDKERKPLVCHVFIRDGQIQFLSDCTHKLAGQTVPVP